MKLEHRRRVRRFRERLKLLWESDERRIRRKYRSEMGRDLDLDDPRTFNEKQLWLNLRHRDPRWVACSDKYAVREYVRERVGADYLIPLLGVYEDSDELDVDALPDQFVIKATHGSGWNLVVRDKRQVDWLEARRVMDGWLATNYYSHKREWQYRDIQPRLVVEKLLLDEEGRVPADYKLFCFPAAGPSATVIEVDLDRFTPQHGRNFYDSEWRRLDLWQGISNADRDPPRPACLEEMIDVSRRLAEDFHFVRVDLYVVSGRPFFGELTFTSGAGTTPFHPDDWDHRLGDLIELPVAGR